MILHIDMDAFYASIEIRDQPELRGKPVVVGGSPKGRGVISAASYEARKFGLHSAMPAAQAIRLCPQAIFIRPRMEHYAAVSKQIREIFNRFTSLIEPISLDEAFLDVSGSTGLFGDPESIAKQIKTTILEETGLIASAGVAPNKFLAKVASDLDKPDGLTIVDRENVNGFLDPLPIKRLWGVGKVTQKRFESMGVTTVGQIRQLPLKILQSKFGVNADHFWRLCRGLDKRRVVSDRNAKSISHESTFATDIESGDALRAWILELSDQVARRMRRYEIVGKTATVKIRFSDFKTITRSNSIREPSNSSERWGREAIGLLNSVVEANETELHQRGGVRLLGFATSSLRIPGPVQLGLFDQQEKEKSKRVDGATDEIRDKFGSSALTRASSLRFKIKHRPDPRIDDEDK